MSERQWVRDKQRQLDNIRAQLDNLASDLAEEWERWYDGDTIRERDQRILKLEAGLRKIMNMGCEVAREEQRIARTTLYDTDTKNL